VIAQVGRERLVAGNLALLVDHGIGLRTLAPWTADGAPAVFVARDEQLLGVIEVADTLRPEAREAIDALRAMHVRSILLTGDAQGVADAVARELGTDEVAAELLPEQKRDWVTASTMRRRWRPRPSVLPWVPAPTLRGRARTSCSWATTWSSSSRRFA